MNDDDEEAVSEGSVLPSPGEKFWALIEDGIWQERTMERYRSAGFDDDHGCEHKLSDIGLTWRLTQPTCTVTPWAVICKEHGQQFLTEAEYERQLDRPDSVWTCPVCGDSALWDDLNYERSEAEVEGNELRDALAHIAELCSAIDALAHIAELCSAIETQSPTVTNEFVENARKRAREFLESAGSRRDLRDAPTPDECVRDAT